MDVSWRDCQSWSLHRAIWGAAEGKRLWTAEQLGRIRAWNEAVGEKLKTLTARESVVVSFELEWLALGSWTENV